MKRLTPSNKNDLAAKVSSDNPFYQLIQQAYRVFNQAPTEHAVCDCCMSQKIRNDFFRHKQADLPLHYIRDWFFAAADNPMDQSAWRFVLPRILEILASGEEPSNTALELSLSRFETGRAENWTSAQWAVLDEFQKLYLYRVNINNVDSIDDLLCMFVSAGWDINELFSQILEWPMDKLVNQLWSDWCQWPNPTIVVTPFWNNESIPMKLYTSEQLLEKITDYALDDKTSNELAKKAMKISDLINSYPTRFDC